MAKKQSNISEKTPPASDDKHVLGYIDASEWEEMKDKAFFYDQYEELTGINIYDVVVEKLQLDSSKVSA